MKLINLEQFCNPNDELRDVVREPFSMGEFTYATDGHVIVRINKRINVKELNYQPALNLFNEHCCYLHKPINLNLPTKEETKCTYCVDGEEPGSCPICGELSMCYAEKCFICNGTGKVNSDQEKSVEIEGNSFCLKYIRLISNLPSLRIKAKKMGGGYPILHFLFGDDNNEIGEGLLMGLNVERNIHI